MVLGPVGILRGREGIGNQLLVSPSCRDAWNSLACWSRGQLDLSEEFRSSACVPTRRLNGNDCISDGRLLKATEGISDAAVPSEFFN
jgi:hypothetical protein